MFKQINICLSIYTHAEVIDTQTHTFVDDIQVTLDKLKIPTSLYLYFLQAPLAHWIC